MLEVELITLRRSTRYDEYLLVADGGEPKCFDEAMRDENNEECMEVMRCEMKSSHENHKYDLVKSPKGKRALRNKWWLCRLM